MILNITNGNTLLYSEKSRVNLSIDNSSEVKEDDPVKIDITKWIKDEHFESDSKLKSLLRMKQQFKVFMGCIYTDYS